LYCFSVENFGRPKEEFNYLMRLFDKEFDELIKSDRLENDKIKIVFIGRISMFPKGVQEKMGKIMEITKNFTDYQVNFAMGYGGKAEVVDAAKKVAEAVKKGELKVSDINEEVFSKNLYMEDEPDLIIRTGGAKRTSNFLIWQSSYSEWIFLEKFWPEFEKEDFLECIAEYGRRERRFGK
jgi:undecaprenyl diphosphate synthase